MLNLPPRLQLLARFQESATAWASRARRNGQQLAMYADRCTEIVRDLDQSLRVERSPTDEEYLQDLMAVSRLEVIMLTLHPTIVDEVGGSGPTPESCESWEKNQLNIERALRDLHCEPFKAPAEPWEEDLDNAMMFDEWTWVTRLLDSINASFPEQFEEQRALVRKIQSLEIEFWASDRNARGYTIAFLVSVLQAAWQEGRLPIAEIGNKSQFTTVLNGVLQVLRESEPNPRQIPPSIPLSFDRTANTSDGSPGHQILDDRPGLSGASESFITHPTEDEEIASRVEYSPSTKPLVHGLKDDIPFKTLKMGNASSGSLGDQVGIDQSASSGNLALHSSDEEETGLRKHHSRSPEPLVLNVQDEITWDATSRPIAQGVHYEQFLGTHRTVGKVALKRVIVRNPDETDEALETLIRHFKAVGSIWMELRHEYILQCLGTFTQGQDSFLVSPFMEHGNFRQWLGREEPPGLERLRLIRELADALVYIHARGIIHGDIKAHHILLSNKLHVQLCGFGLAYRASSGIDPSLGNAMTARWASPEILNDNPKSYKSDVYAFAMTIVEVLTGQIPFAARKSELRVIVAVGVRHERPPKSPVTSSDGTSYVIPWNVAELCWVDDPNERISMTEAAGLLSV